MPEENQNYNTEIRQLLEENLRLTQELHAMTKKIKHFVTFQKIMSAVYFLLFIVPLILAVLYLPKFLTEYLQPYKELIQGGQKMNTFDSTDDMLNQAQKIINSDNNVNNNAIK